MDYIKYLTEDVLPFWLNNAIDNLFKDKNRIEQIGKNAREMAVVDATSRICDIVLGLIKN